MAKLSALENTNKMFLNTAGTTVLSKRKPISSISFHPDFQNLFPINPTTLQQIKESMKEHGYDESQPLLIWKEEGVLLDGHTRLAAAKELGFFDIPIYEKSFSSLEQALEYALSLQVARRNLTDDELYRAVLALDSLKKPGIKTEGKKESVGKSAAVTAELLDTSRSQVERIRAIHNNANEEIKKQLLNKEISIHKAYQSTKKEKPLTLYQVIKKKTVKELAAYLVLVQQQHILTETQWIDELNQMSFFDNPLKPEWAKTPTATKDSEPAEEDVEIDVEDLL